MMKLVKFNFFLTELQPELCSKEFFSSQPQRCYKKKKAVVSAGYERLLYNQEENVASIIFSICEYLLILEINPAI